jgi:acetyl-CoA carboxylase biotin carboxylase subunit
MIGKLIVHQPTRREAINCMLRALAEFQVEGIPTTIPFHREILQHSAFVEGEIDTSLVERFWLT